MPGEFSGTLVSLLQRRGVAEEEGGILSGQDPSAYNEHDTIRLWIIQVSVIVLTTQLLALLLRKFRQPSVIAEIFGGILLGPTALGRIPGFTKHIFPEVSRPYLSLTANIGLCLFLFLVGLEIDGKLIKRNAKSSAIVSLAGIILPFAFGAALAVPIYHRFIPSAVKFSHFVLFTGVANSITAFPVVCRILNELNMIDTNVGVVVLSAGVANDIIGWLLLALCVALVNAGSELTALYMLLLCVAWGLTLFFPVKMFLRWLARKTGSVENGPTKFFMTVIMLLLFVSAFFTDIIGVHAVFGAFLMGVVVPRDGGLVVALTERLEDIVQVVLLPLYFTLSGLSTDLGLLNNGITWGYTLALCAFAFMGNFGGSVIASKFVAGFTWRESSVIGTLMTCKGLVELIVLNIGLSAKILTPQVFSMFVLESLLLTFITTPLVSILYPPHLRSRPSKKGSPSATAGGKQVVRRERNTRAKRRVKSHFTVVLDKIEHVPQMMSFVQLLRLPLTQAFPSEPSSATTSNDSPPTTPTSPSSARGVKVSALRLIESADRVSDVIKSSTQDELLETDPALLIFRMFAKLNSIVLSAVLTMAPLDDLAHTALSQAERDDADMIVLAWSPPSRKGLTDNAPSDNAVPAADVPPPPSKNVFKAFFKSSSTAPPEECPEPVHSHFVQGVFEHATTDVALFIDHNTSAPAPATSGYERHIFLPYFGGADDRLALDLVVQLCGNENVTATVVRIAKHDPEAGASSSWTEKVRGSQEISPATLVAPMDTDEWLQNETADNLAWSRYASPSKATSMNAGLARIEFKRVASPTLLRTSLHEAVVCTQDRSAELIVIVGRSHHAVQDCGDFVQELKAITEGHNGVDPGLHLTIGDVAPAFVVAGCSAGVIVVQAATVVGDNGC
ncbi:hypothetical protein HGRIS_006679 [Hohenbuehelia grisea]|uniref:Cation/H+ exchanger transmembrane domain-containing protein n=1 Tax=Hohenbuehelia grisea TaxID=104357 RepID=A0ABR3JAC8_9AGAR